MTSNKKINKADSKPTKGTTDISEKVLEDVRGKGGTYQLIDGKRVPIKE